METSKTKKIVKTFDFSKDFLDAISKIKGVEFDWDEIKPTKIHTHFRASFNLWRVNIEGIKMETTITKHKQSELESAVIAFLSWH
jgi:hypothetical protein